MDSVTKSAVLAPKQFSLQFEGDVDKKLECIRFVAIGNDRTSLC